MNTCECTKQVKPWTTEQKNYLRKITETGIRLFPELVRCFKETSAQVAYNANQQGYDWKLLYEMELELIEMFKHQRLEEGVTLFAERWMEYMQRFFPACDLASYKEFLTKNSERHKALSTPVLESLVAQS